MKAKVSMAVCVWVTGLAIVGPATVSATEVTLGADIASSYVWRGITLNKDAVVQTSLVVEHAGGFSIEVWSNFDLGDDGGAYVKHEFSEIDFGLSYTLDLDPVSVTIGYTEFTFPAAGGIVDEQTGDVVAVAAEREGYIGVSAEFIGGLSLALTAYRDFAASDATYAVFAADYGMAVAAGFSLTLSGSIAYGARGATAGGKSGLHDYLIGLTAEYTVANGVALTAFVNHVGSLNSDVLPKNFVREDVFGGVGLRYTF